MELRARVHGLGQKWSASIILRAAHRIFYRVPGVLFASEGRRTFFFQRHRCGKSLEAADADLTHIQYEPIRLLSPFSTFSGVCRCKIAEWSFPLRVHGVRVCMMNRAAGDLDIPGTHGDSVVRAGGPANQWFFKRRSVCSRGRVRFSIPPFSLAVTGYTCASTGRVGRADYCM